MIEFIERTGQERRPVAVKVDDIVSVQPEEGGSTSIVLEGGRTMVADHPYSEIRRIILEVRRRFASAL